MKIGNKAINHTKCKSGLNKNSKIPRIRLKLSEAQKYPFQYPHRCGSNCNNTTSFPFGLFKTLCCFFLYLDIFLMHDMVFQHLCFNRQKCSKTHMKSNKFHLNTFTLQSL